MKLVVFLEKLWITWIMNPLRIFWSSIKSAWRTILSNKMRTFLSMLWIVIGMSSVIVMMAIGAGAKELVMKNMGDMAKNTLSIYPGWGYRDWDDEGDRPVGFIKKIEFTKQHVLDLVEAFPELKGKVTYFVRDYWRVEYEKKKNHSQFLGVLPHFFTLNEKELAKGELFSRVHYEKASYSVVINDGLKTKLFWEKNPIGKKVKVSDKLFTVIGVLKKWDNESDWDQQMYAPISTLFKLNNTTNISTIEINLNADRDNDIWKNRVQYFFMKSFNITDAKKTWFNISGASKWVEKAKESTQTFNYLLIAIGSISLLVGGIWVMNIMLVSVTERTREIWIRKAIGALNSDIVVQFLVESIMITFVGGLIALWFSLAIIIGLNKYIFAWDGWGLMGGGMWWEMHAVLDIQVILTSFVFTAITGIIFGILPARKAAQLKPIDALRFE